MGQLVIIAAAASPAPFACDALPQSDTLLRAATFAPRSRTIDRAGDDCRCRLCQVAGGTLVVMTGCETRAAIPTKPTRPVGNIRVKSAHSAQTLPKMVLAPGGKSALSVIFIEGLKVLLPRSPSTNDERAHQRLGIMSRRLWSRSKVSGTASDRGKRLVHDGRPVRGGLNSKYLTKPACGDKALDKALDGDL
jgi:hypothetical protein